METMEELDLTHEAPGSTNGSGPAITLPDPDPKGIQKPRLGDPEGRATKIARDHGSEPQVASIPAPAAHGSTSRSKNSLGGSLCPCGNGLLLRRKEDDEASKLPIRLLD